jgi:predicted house-cleaning noncanonical NTP pyrophosphatase (MazG superfamily)
MSRLSASIVDTSDMAEKLVRDRVPELYGTTPNNPAYRIAEPSEMFGLLIDKLREETEELARSRDPAELADVVEVARALTKEIGLTQQAIEAVRQSKFEQAGAFSAKIVWCNAPDGPLRS